jgi:hypothetical protein
LSGLFLMNCIPICPLLQNLHSNKPSLEEVHSAQQLVLFKDLDLSTPK